MPLRIVAIIAAYNEERFIGGCLDHLFANGVEAYLCDNESTDRTVEIARSYLGRGLRGIETLPRDGTYRWRQILARKEQLSAQLDADWFLHLDPDEIPQAAKELQSLAAGLTEADAAGYNAVNFQELTFVAPREEPDHDHPAFRETLRWYYPFAPKPLHRVIAWKRQREVDLVATGGHQARFPGRRISPERFFLKHYLVLSRDHLERKYVRRRYDAGEVRRGWHGWRAQLTSNAIDLPSQRQMLHTSSDADLDGSAPRRRHFIEWPRPRPRAGDDARPVVLCIVNRPGWAHDIKTKALASALASEYNMVTRYHADVTAAEIESADLVLVYYWLQLDELAHLRPTLERVRDRVMLGVCSGYELDGARRSPGLRLLSRLPAAIFANNLSLVRELEATLDRRVFYTPNGVDTNFFRPPEERPPSTMMRVGWAGSLTNHGSAHRGVREYIEPAVARLENVELQLAAREDRWRNAGEMREFYASLDVYVCASRSEGTPNPCLEAAASGLPVVTTRVGNMPEFIRDGENGFFVSRDVEDLAAKLRHLRDDPSLRERMGRAARESALEWDWRCHAPHYARMFEAMFDGKVDGPPERGRVRRAVDAILDSRFARTGWRAAWRLAPFWRGAED